MTLLKEFNDNANMQMPGSIPDEAIAGYTILSPSTSGPGEWSTYLAEDRSGTRVFLRLLPCSQIPSDKQSEFEIQTKKLVNLIHPNLLRVLRAGKSDTHFYLICEWVKNDSLQERLESSSGEIEILQLLLMLRQVIQALAVALRQGIGHGNLSASWIYYDHQGRIKVDGAYGDSNIEGVFKDRQALADLLEPSINENTRPEIYPRLAKLLKFIVNPELEKTPIGYQKILEQMAPIISLCDGLKRFYDVSLFCPYCRDPLASGKLVRCIVCFTPHHKSCWRETAKCSVYNCAGKDIVRIRTKKQTVYNSLLIASITLIALIGWGFYFYGRLTPTGNLPVRAEMIPQDIQRSKTQVRAKDKSKNSKPPIVKLAGSKPAASPKMNIVPSSPVSKAENGASSKQNLIALLSPPEKRKPLSTQPAVPVQFTMERPDVLFPKPGDKLYVGSTYEIKWVNTVPAKYRNNPNIKWLFTIYSPFRFSKNYEFPPATSSFQLAVTEDFIIADDYKFSIWLGYSCNDRNFECLAPNNNGYVLEEPFSVGLPGVAW